jgi:hypothetical protein
MRLKTTHSKNAVHYSIIKDCVVKGKKTTMSVENLGNLQKVQERAGNMDPTEWMKEYINKLNKLEKEENQIVLVSLNPKKIIPKNKQVKFNAGYLFLQAIYYSLGFPAICKVISSKYRFTYDLNDILSKLIYCRILYPSSKLATFTFAKKLLEQPSFDLQHIYRSLDVIAVESDYIQSQLYKNSLKIFKRNDGILYYDCTNFFFEVTQEEGLKKYSKSKDHKPNPIVQMGLFMDGDGIPLAFNINPGNTNEQITLRPLEKRIMRDFELSRFIICTDAGLASTANRKYNNVANRAFITTQSIKKLKKHLKDWALDDNGWNLVGSEKVYNLKEIDEQFFTEKVFYKERWINENSLEQRMIVTFSIKYRNYQRTIRANQVNRALKEIDSKKPRKAKANQNDYKRFIKKIDTTKHGEIADESHYQLDTTLVAHEEQFDGFYGVCTNLEDPVNEIIKINKQRWEIEESFRIMKHDFLSRPVQHQKDVRIEAHFNTCFLALTIFRYLEKILESDYTSTQIIRCLKDYELAEVTGFGYQPIYTKTDLVELLHDKFGFRTDFEITSIKRMKKIIKGTKSK